MRRTGKPLDEKPGSGGAEIRSLAEADLRQFHLALDGSADMIALVDRATMKFVEANRAMCRLLGYTREELLAKNLDELLPVSRKELEAAYDSQIADPSLAGGMNSYYLCKDGSRLPFESKRQVLRSGGKWLISIVSRDIRERLKAESTLRESEARFRSLTELSSDFYWETDAGHRLSKAIHGSKYQPAFAPGSQTGKTRWEIPSVSPDAAGWAAHRALLDAHEPFRDFEFSRRDSASAVRTLSISGEPIFDDGGAFRGYRGVGQEITARKRIEEELRANRRLLEIVIDAIPMSIFAKDTNSNYVMVNRYLAEFFESTKQELLQLHTSRLPTHEATRQQSIRDDQWVYQNRRTFTHETLIQRPDGTPVPFHSSKIPLFDDGGALIGLLGVNRDISEERRAQEEAREARERIERFNVELEERVEERTAELRGVIKELDAFTYSVSHDLRSPVGAVSGFANLLRTSEAQRLSDDGKHLLGVIEKNAERMVDLIEGLLRFSRLGRAKIQRQPLSMGALVRETLRELEAESRAEIEVGRLPDCAGDPVLLHQVWANIISNALKYSKTRAPARIEIGWDTGEQAYFVRDNGVGFDMQYAGKLFGAFERLHADEEFAGSGIGLAIVERIIDRHGGRIWAEAVVNHGATFWFTVAAAPPNPELSRGPGRAP